MIRLIVGGIGSGKTSSAVQEILNLGEQVMVYSNFPILGKTRCKHTRLKIEHIMQEIHDPEHPKRKPTYKVNFDYWRQALEANPQISIFIDEAHNVMNARRSQSKWNVIFSEWLVQIRKILGEHETNHLTLVTQRVSAVDIIARELAMQIISVKKIVREPATPCKVRLRGRLVTRHIPQIIIIKHYFNGRYCLDKYASYTAGINSYDARSAIVMNPIFAFYESYALVDFGSGVYV